MKKIFLLIVCLLAGLSITAQNKKVNIVKAEASSSQPGVSPDLVRDGDYNTYWYTPYDKNEGSSTKFPVTLTVTFEEITHVGFMRYIPRQDGSSWAGHWQGSVKVAYCPDTTGTSFRDIGSYSLSGDATVYDFQLGEEGVECGQIRFTITSGDFFYASAAEIEAYTYDIIKEEDMNPYFADDLYIQLKPEVTSSAGIQNEVIKTLVDNLLTDAEGYRKFRVGEYEPYLRTQTLKDILKSSDSYNKYENPTGVYFNAGEPCWVVASGIDDRYPVGLIIKNWVTDEKSSSYTLRNGLNYITPNNEGNAFVSYYTDDFEIAPNVKVHFLNGAVQGYWDQATMTNEDWAELLEGRSADDNTIIITRSEHAQLAYPVSAWLKYCPENVDSVMTLYQQVQWAQRNMLGLEKYGRQVKNRQLFYASTTGFMAAVEEGAFCNVNSLDAIMVPDAKKFDFWGVGHEWGHNNQVNPGFKWSGCGETTNNIFASWGQLHFSGNPHYLRLEDEVSGVDEYSGMRGGRMQVYFEEAIRKGVPWQMQDGPDYHGAELTSKNVDGYDADGNNIGSVTTTSRNYDHFVKLTPFWQLNLWGTMAGKCPDIIPMVIESIRSTPYYASTYGTNGKKQVNWMKLACDSAKIDLLPFFEKAGMLLPINTYIEDYQAGWNIITEAMINDLKAYVKEQGYPASGEEINYINGHNYHIYRDCLKLEVPEKLNTGCILKQEKVTIQHSEVKNAVAYETYNYEGKLLRITMYGLGSDDSHSYTQVLFPENYDMDLKAAYIMAVGYDGTRAKVYESENIQEIFREKFEELFEQTKEYLTRTDDTGTKLGFLFPSAIVESLAFVTELDSLIENTPEEGRDYRVWYIQIKEVLNELLNDTSKRVPLNPKGIYSIAASSNASRYLKYLQSGLKAVTSQEVTSALQWRIVPAQTDSTYYIQSRETGNYISEVLSGKLVKALSSDVANAVEFKLATDAPGIFYLRANDTGLNLYYNVSASNKVYAGSSNGTSAKWTLTLVDVEDETHVVALENSGLTMLVQDESIVINGLTAGNVVSIYDAMGRRLETTTATGSSIVIHTGLSKGEMAIVSVNGKSVKVLMK